MRRGAVVAGVSDAEKRDSEHDTFLRVFAMLNPAGLQTALLRLAQNSAGELDDVVAVDGKVLRRSLENASERSPDAPAAGVAASLKLTLAQVSGRQVERDPAAAAATGTVRREGSHDGRRRDARARRHGGGESLPREATTRWR